MCLFILCVGGSMVLCSSVEVKEQLARVGSLLSLCGSWGSKSAHQQLAQFPRFTADTKASGTAHKARRALSHACHFSALLWHGKVLGLQGSRVEYTETMWGLCFGRSFLRLQALGSCPQSSEAILCYGVLPSSQFWPHWVLFISSSLTVLYSFKGRNLKDFLRGLVHSLLNKWTKKISWMNKWTTECMNKWMSERRNNECMNKWMSDCINKWVSERRNNAWTNEWVKEETLNAWINGQVNVWIKGWVNGWTNEWVRKWMDGWMNELVNKFTDGSPGPPRSIFMAVMGNHNCQLDGI